MSLATDKHQQLNDLQQNPAAPDSLPTAVSGFLGKLRLLENVPFPSLVPDDRMLPPESIRFFYMDLNWTDSLIDGAYSIGRVTTGDTKTDAVAADLVKTSAQTAASTRRSDLLGSTTADTPPVQNEITGILIRSGVVKGWPGLEVEAFAAGSQTPLRIIRMEHLSEQVLMAIFDGVIATVTVHEPPEALHFGLDMPDATIDQPHTYFKKLRPLKAGDLAGGKDIPAQFRSGNVPVLNVVAMANAMQQAFSGETFTAAEFGLQMVEGVGRVNFVRTNSGT